MAEKLFKDVAEEVRRLYVEIAGAYEDENVVICEWEYSDFPNTRLKRIYKNFGTFEINAENADCFFEVRTLI